MNKHELKTILKELKWSKAELARRLGLDPHTVSRWGDRVPEYAVRYVELVQKIRDIGK